MAKKKHKPDPAGWLIKRKRDGDKHIKACKDGYWKTPRNSSRSTTSSRSAWMADGTIKDHVPEPEEVKFIRNCLKETKWDINAGENCVGLPLKPVYGDKRAPSGWDKLPCHQVDHNPDYTDEVASIRRQGVESQHSRWREMQIRPQEPAVAAGKAQHVVAW